MKRMEEMRNCMDVQGGNVRGRRGWRKMMLSIWKRKDGSVWCMNGMEEYRRKWEWRAWFAEEGWLHGYNNYWK
jgi:hypothetical protein